MPNTVALAILFSAIFESLIIIAGNIFTIFVFWKHRNRLKRTSFLLINLAVADLLVGITEPVALGTFEIPRHLYGPGFNSKVSYGNILLPLQITFSCASVLFLVHISLERAFALIWPLRHRVASIKGYIYSVIFAWIAGTSVGILIYLGVDGVLNFVHPIVIFGCTVVLCLITVCVSYLAIRARLTHKISAFEGAHNRRNGQQLNAKFSRTMFVVVAASLFFWFPSVVLYCTHFICSACLPPALIELCNVLRLGNSLVNPIIYSFRMSMFKETFKRMKLCKQSKH